MENFTDRALMSSIVFEPKRGIHMGTNMWNHSPIEVKSLQLVVSPRRLLLKSTRYS
jgi:hypothetical protein